ncbi:MAG: MMPL family transporter, partial [Myxococcota bacterium]
MNAWLSRLAGAQAAHPWRFLLIGVLLAAGSVPLIRTLSIDARMVALLPRDQPAVQDLEAARARMRSGKSLTVAVESPSANVEGLRAAVDAIAAALHQIPQEEIGAVDESVRRYQAFAREYAHLFVPLADLEALRTAIREEARQARLAANPLYIDFEDDDEEAESLEDVTDRLRARADRSASRYPDGYYQAEDGTLIALFVRVGLSAPEYGDGAILRRVRSVIDGIDLSEYGDDLSVHIAGDVIIQREEQAAITAELGIALLITLSGVLLLVLLYFRRFRALPLLAMGLGPGTAASFALASVTVGQLNLTTAFLGSVLLGNGINPSIIWLARYFEERRRGAETREAIEKTHHAVFIATLVAASAAAAAYGSLMITDFRGFRDFGVIGGAGMLFSWLSAILLLPAAAAVAERLRPLKLEGTKPPALTEPFARIVERAPRGVLIGSALAAVVAVAVVGSAVSDDPFEYDFRQLRSERPDGDSEARRINRAVNGILSSSMQGRGIAALTESRELLNEFKEALDARRGDGAD